SACGNASNDVWYSFVAEDSTHVLDIRNLESGGTTAYLGAAVYSGTCPAGLEEVQCAQYIEMTGVEFPGIAIDSLVIGQTYYVQIWTNVYEVDAVYDIGITTLPVAPNDECADAIDI